MARGADLYVVCKNCGSEVSPYITECPYCGQRVRKRAPKIERPGAAPREPKRTTRARARTGPALRVGRLRRPTMPGLAVTTAERPWATIVLVAASFIIYLLAVATLIDRLDLIVFGKLGGDWWRIFSAPLVHVSGGTGVFAGGAYQLAAMFAVGVFGTLLERRHGAWVVVALFVLAGAGGMLVEAAIDTTPVAFGANGLGLGLLCAWAVPDLLAWRAGRQWEGDLLATAVIAAVLLLMPLAVDGASAVAGFTGALVGLAVGYPLARLRPR